MANITLKGASIQTCGSLPAKGTKAPDFCLTSNDLTDFRLADITGKKLVLNIVPSLDTGICAASAKRFNEEVEKLGDTVILTISADLPFASKRFCEAESINLVKTLSSFRSPEFGKAYGTTITTGPLRGLESRAIIILDKNHRVVYSEQVPEIAQHPDYDKSLQALKELQ